MQVETRESPSTDGPKDAPTARRRWSRKITAGLVSLGTVGAVTLGVFHDGGSDRSITPSEVTRSLATVSDDVNGASIVPFTVDTPATVDGVSSFDR